MTERLPRVTADDAIRVLERAGFSFSRQSGSHKIYKNKEGKRATVPYHSGKILHPKTSRGITTVRYARKREKRLLPRGFVLNAQRRRKEKCFYARIV